MIVNIIRHGKPDYFGFEADNKEELCRASEIEKGLRRYETAKFTDPKFKQGYLKLLDASDAFLEKLGFRHDRENHFYRILLGNEKKSRCFTMLGSLWHGCR